MVDTIRAEIATNIYDVKAEITLADNVNDLLQCHEKAEEAVERVIKKGYGKEDVIVDYTGGTKNMSVAIALASITHGFSFSYVGGKERKIKIPAGIYEGARINFGDFTLSVNIKPHKLFERQDDDIYVTVGIPFSLAVLGGEIKVPTIGDEIKIRIRQGTQSGVMMRLREQGVPHLHGRGKGDEYVRINVAIPEKLNRNQKSLIEEMKEEGL